jgi:hypothetical protein
MIYIVNGYLCDLNVQRLGVFMAKFLTVLRINIPLCDLLYHGEVVWYVS